MLELIMGVIGTLLYPLCSVIFICVDGLQSVFEAFAGIGDIYVRSNGGLGFNYTKITSGNTGLLEDTGLIYYLLQSNIVKNLFFSILLLALFLIIIFTAMAFIKNVYQPKPKSWQDIVGSAIKGLANFIFIPVCCLLGVWLGNILLKAINGATSSTGATTMSNKLFIAASYNANRYRCYGVTDGGTMARYAYSIADLGDLEAPDSDVDATEYYANAVDRAFSTDDEDIKAMIYKGTYDRLDNDLEGLIEFYVLAKINYLVLIVGGVFILYVLGSLAFGMVRRLFILLTLFVISPALCAMYPLDDGNAVKQWKSSFIKETISAYAAVAGLNIFFSLIPIVDNITISPIMSGIGFEAFLHLFLFVSGLFVVKELISMIAGFIGGNDAFSAGSGLMKNASQAIGKRVGKAASITAGAFGAAKGAKAAGGDARFAFFKEFGKGIGNVGKDALKTATGGSLDIAGLQKSYKDTEKDTKEHYWDKANERYKKVKQDTKYKDDGAEAAFNAAVRAANGGRLSKDQIDDLLGNENFTKDARDKLKDEIMKYQNANAWMRDDGTGKRFKFSERGEVERLTADKIDEKHKQRMAATEGKESVAAAQSNFTQLHSKASIAETKFDDFVASNAGIDFDNATRLSANEIEVQRIKAAQTVSTETIDAAGNKTVTTAFTAEALAAQQVLEEQGKLQEYDKLKEASEKLTTEVKQAAESFAQTVERAAESQSEKNKATFKAVAQDVENAANLLKKVNEKDTAGNTIIVKAIEDAVKKINSTK